MSSHRTVRDATPAQGPWSVTGDSHAGPAGCWGAGGVTLKSHDCLSLLCTCNSQDPECPLQLKRKQYSCPSGSRGRGEPGSPHGLLDSGLDTGLTPSARCGAPHTNTECRRWTPGPPERKETSPFPAAGKRRSRSLPTALARTPTGRDPARRGGTPGGRRGGGLAESR